MTTEHYKYLLNSLGKYNSSKDFDTFWGAVMPMFKYLSELVYILRGLRRFITNTQKTQFDAEMEKHFIVE